MTQLIKSLNQYSTTVLESNLLDDSTVKSIDIIDASAGLLIHNNNNSKKHTSLNKRSLDEDKGVTTPQVKEAKTKSSISEEGEQHIVRDSVLPRVNKITPKMNPNKNWKENYQQQVTQRK